MKKLSGNYCTVNFSAKAILGWKKRCAYFFFPHWYIGTWFKWFSYLAAWHLVSLCHACQLIARHGTEMSRAKVFSKHKFLLLNFHLSSTDTGPCHGVCPNWSDMWCIYNRHMHEDKLFAHKETLPSPVLEAVKSMLYKAITSRAAAEML